VVPQIATEGKGKGKRELQKRFEIWKTTHAVMLEQLLIFTRGGLLLWTYQELANSLKGSPVNALIRYNGSPIASPPSLFLLLHFFPSFFSLLLLSFRLLSLSLSLSLSLASCLLGYTCKWYPASFTSSNLI
jgi:hypothetical protein